LSIVTASIVTASARLPRRLSRRLASSRVAFVRASDALKASPRSGVSRVASRRAARRAVARSSLEF
jgi:hypothetical protein